MSLITTIAAFLLALAILIVFHELGHYWVARWCGVKILRFSVGFGKPLYVWRGAAPDRTEWAIAALPFGGFVRMLDEREAPVAAAERHRAFNLQTVWKRIAIVAAGPIANFLLAIVVYAGIFMYGVAEPRPIFGKPVAGSAAATAGIVNGDVVQRLNGEPVRTWQDLRWGLLDIAVARGLARLDVVDARGNVTTRRLDLSAARMDEAEGDPLARAGLRLFRPPLEAVIGVLEAGGAGVAAGLRDGDRIRAVDGAAISTFDQLVEHVIASPGQGLSIDLERKDGTREKIIVTPKSVERDGRVIGRIGAGPKVDLARFKELAIEERYGLVEAVRKAVVKTWDMSIFSLRMLGKMLIGEISWRNLSGPVTIADYAGQSASLGAMPYLMFIALVSISLGVLNLLPIPVLDGGHLLYYAIELLKGKPLSDRTMEMGQRVGMVLLLSLMVFAFYNDINRLLSS